MPASTPCLSICLPTYSRADLLERCLTALLPQLDPYANKIECIVSDNASPDHTPEIIAKFAKHPCLRSFRNETNLGILGNITTVVTQYATGKYAFLIGDDDIVLPGAIERIMNILQRPDAPDLVALNVGYQDGEHRPQAAELAAFLQTMTMTKTLRPHAASGRYSLSELLTGPDADFTASYSVIIPRQWWCDEFPTPFLDAPFTEVRNTYPHAHLIAKRMGNQLGELIAEPSVLIFEMPANEFSWSKYRGIVSTLHSVSLLKEFSKNGVPQETLAPYFLNLLQHRSAFLGDLLWDPDCAGGWREAIRYGWDLKRHPYELLRSFAIAGLHPKSPRWLRWLAESRLKNSQ
ncbi:putative glycosyl transferase [Roseimaritima multifibrata]|uniref:Putative glycosyl transferase n=1 Tax=Roseimaritima multifibrata TaxID=1930274 RepID=A0A517MM52_9BACT|nr:glycosyltransferase family 2 protein [Roseimaritima multifibrata]QDS95972.1 putative glycosyl transferase [Roseimaritima multifibrata]